MADRITQLQDAINQVSVMEIRYPVICIHTTVPLDMFVVNNVSLTLIYLQRYHIQCTSIDTTDSVQSLYELNAFIDRD